MADIRINSLPTTASSSSSDDFLALDGTTNGTRKLNAYSPTFGGNATVGGTLTVSSSATVATNLSLSNVSGYNFLGFNNAQNLSTATGIYSATGDGNLYLNVPTTYTVRARINGSDKLTVSSTSTNIEGSLTVKGPDNGSLYLDTSSATNYTSLYFKNNGGSNAFGIYHYTGDASTTINSFGGNLIFSRTAGELGRFVNSSGNLLLGTTTDGGQKLQVAGSAYIGSATASTNLLTVQGNGPNTTHQAGTSTAALWNRWLNSAGTRRGYYGYASAGDSTFTIMNEEAGSFVLGTNATTALTLDSSQNATFAGNIKTAAPSGGTAATWRLGTVASVTPTSPNRTIEVEIGGTTYYIAAKTTND